MQEWVDLMENKKPILKNNVRILRPKEWWAIHYHLYPWERVRFEGLTFTGMRYREAQRFQDDPTWFDGDFIIMPAGSALKEKAKMKERTVHLSNKGKSLMPYFLKSKARLPTRAWWIRVLKRAAIKAKLDPIGLSVKTTRKTWESWLAMSYQHKLDFIVMSQGHDKNTSMQHYLNLPFLPEDKKAMLPFVEGWD